MDRLSSTLVRVAGSGLLVGLAASAACETPWSHEEAESDCHPVRKCITLTCREKLEEGRGSDAWKDCVSWCRTSRGIARSEATFCAEQIGVTCIRDWYGAACRAARSRCRTGSFRPDEDGGC